MRKIFGLVTIALLVASCGGDDPVTFDEQLAIDIDIIDNYLSDNGLDAQVHESGIRFNETVVGDGRTPAPGEVAVITYEFGILGGDGIIGSSEYGNSFTINSSLIGALFVMLQEMQEGGEMTIYAPSGYCFGTTSDNVIPANAILIFDVQMKTVVRTEAEQFAADTTILENYIDGNEIEALVHESGIRYTVQEEGAGASPSASDRVAVRYEGRFLNGNIFDQNVDGIAFDLSGLIQAWQIMIPTMKEGGKITIYAPSQYCYGPGGSQSIPSNTNLIFDIELISIE